MKSLNCFWGVMGGGGIEKISGEVIEMFLGEVEIFSGEVIEKFLSR